MACSDECDVPEDPETTKLCKAQNDVIQASQRRLSVLRGNLAKAEGKILELQGQMKSQQAENRELRDRAAALDHLRGLTPEQAQAHFDAADKGTQQLPCFPCVATPSDHTWGPCATEVHRSMVSAACHLRDTDASRPSGLVVWTQDKASSNPSNYLSPDFILWDPVKIFGCAMPLCPQCGCNMTNAGWNTQPPRRCYTMTGVILIVGTKYRCANTKKSAANCNHTALSYSPDVLNSFPAAVRLQFPYIEREHHFIENRLQHHWYSLWASSNLSYSRITTIYDNMLTDEWHRRFMTCLHRNSLDWMAYGMPRTQAGQRSLMDCWGSTGLPDTLRERLAFLGSLSADTNKSSLYCGPSVQFVTNCIDVEATRQGKFQDGALRAQISGDFLCGDHTFKLPKNCVSTYCRPFHAQHTIFDGSGVIVSCVMTRDESIYSVEAQHKALANRLKLRGTPPPKIYTVDKCCQFKHIKTFFAYSNEERVFALDMFRRANPEASEGAILAFSARLECEVLMKQDVMHLDGRMMRALPGHRTSPPQKAFLLSYRKAKWDKVRPTDTADVLQLASYLRTVPPKEILAPRYELLREKAQKEPWFNTDARKQIEHAISHARLGCISDERDVSYTWKDYSNGMHTMRGTNIAECFHKELKRVIKPGSIGAAALGALARFQVTRWNIERTFLRTGKDFKTWNLLSLYDLRESITTVLGARFATKLNCAYLPLPLQDDTPNEPFFTDYVHIVADPQSSEAVCALHQAQEDIYLPRLRSAFPTTCDFQAANQSEASFDVFRGVFTESFSRSILSFPGVNVIPDAPLRFMDSVITEISLATDLTYSSEDLIPLIAEHIQMYDLAQLPLYGTRFPQILEKGYSMPDIDDDTPSYGHTDFITFFLRALSSMLGLPIILLRCHPTATVRVISPLIPVDLYPIDHGSPLIFILNGVCNLIPALLHGFRDTFQPPRISTLDLVHHPLESIPLPQPICAVTKCCVRRPADNAPGGALYNQVQTHAGTSKINNRGVVDRWDDADAEWFNDNIHQHLEIKESKGDFKVIFHNKLLTECRANHIKEKELSWPARTPENLTTRWGSIKKSASMSATRILIADRYVKWRAIKESLPLPNFNPSDDPLAVGRKNARSSDVALPAPKRTAVEESQPTVTQATLD